MGIKEFKRKLIKLIESSDEFVVDTIEMDEIRKDAGVQGFDDIIVICGEDHTATFALPIRKCI